MLPHLDSAYRLARFLLRDAVAAEDVVQTAFLNAMRGFGGMRQGSPRAWLLAIVRNAAWDWMRANRGASPDDATQEADWDVDPDTPEMHLARMDDAERVRAAVAALPPMFRETIVLREFEALSYREIAEVQGTAIGTVMSRLARARHLLAASLSDLGMEARA